MANTSKTTKKEWFEIIRDIVENSEEKSENLKEEMIAFINKEIELLDKKAEKTKESNQKKKKENDFIKDIIKSVLSEAPQTIDEIMEKLEKNEDLTRAKVIARLNQLVADTENKVKKGTTKDGKRKLVVYYIFTEEEEEEEEAEN